MGPVAAVVKTSRENRARRRDSTRRSVTREEIQPVNEECQEIFFFDVILRATNRSELRKKILSVSFMSGKNRRRILLKWHQKSTDAQFTINSNGRAAAVCPSAATRCVTLPQDRSGSL